MSDLPGLFLNNLLPIFLAAGAGYLLGKWLPIDVRSVSQLIFYVFSPCLVFNLITGNQLSEGDILSMMSFTAAITAIVGVVAWTVGRLLKLERSMLMAVLLTSMFMNAGNFGLSVNLFAFGEEGLAHASLFFVTTGILTYTVGVVIASMGTSSLKDSLLGLFRVPFVYALLLAIVFLRLDWELPLPLDRTVTLLGNASIPTMLVLLGLQIGRLQLNGSRLPLALVNGIRLVVAPLVALWLSRPFGLEGAARQAGILEAGMPTAVLVTVLATEYDLEPSFVTTVVFVSTFLSPLTLTPLLAYLGG